MYHVEMLRALCILLLLEMAVICGCTMHHPRASADVTAPAAPSIAAHDPIKTHAQYAKVVEAAIRRLPVSITRLHGSARYIACLEQMANLPSNPSRRYTQALIDTLRSEGIPVPVELPASNSPAEVISYAELAEIDAWTTALMYSIDPDPSPAAVPKEQRVPRRVAMRVLVCISETCPSDTIPGAPVWLRESEFGASDKFETQEWNKDDATAVDKLRQKAVDLMFARYRGQGRSLNLTSLRFYEMMTVFGGEGYAGLLSDFADVHGNAAGRKLVGELVATARRARSLDRSSDVQKAIDLFISLSFDFRKAYFSH